MKITELLESTTVKAEKPRNFVAKHAKTSGAGKMKDKSKTLPRQEKHKKPAMAETVAATHKGGEVSRKDGVTRHKAGPSVYGGSEHETDPDTKIDKNFINKSEKAIGVKWPKEKKYQGSINVEEAGPTSCWPGHRKVGTQPGTGKNAGKPVNKCKKIGEQSVVEGSVKELQLDLRVLTDEQFQSQYRMTKAQARAGLRGKSDVTETADAASTSAGNVSVGVVYKNKPPKMQKPGTNALDKDDLLTGGSLIKRR